MTYFIAEIGQNHNGFMETALELIETCSEKITHEGNELKGVDAVKFTVRDLEHECSPKQWNTPYKNKNSFGATYGEHRTNLELSYENIKILREHAHDKGLDFILTICNPGIVEKFIPLADKVKIASRDLKNIPLLEKLCTYDKTFIFSMGMDYMIEAAESLQRFQDKTIWLMHCVSSYPTPYNEASLLKIRDWINQIRNVEKIGYSDHTTGILAPSIAVALGAQVIEKHVTLNRNATGSDHQSSLSPEGLKRCLRDIRNTEIMLKTPFMHRRVTTVKTRDKIGRSLAVNKDIEIGHIFTKEDFIMVSPGTGFQYNLSRQFIGKPSRDSMKKNQLLT